MNYNYYIPNKSGKEENLEVTGAVKKERERETL